MVVPKIVMVVVLVAAVMSAMEVGTSGAIDCATVLQARAPCSSYLIFTELKPACCPNIQSIFKQGSFNEVCACLGQSLPAKFVGYRAASLPRVCNVSAINCP